jgi:hypothetical protein
MGVSENPTMLFNLEELLNSNFDLSSLTQPISKEEIDRVIQLMPSDKAPGPNGFIIKDDFYKLCQAFFDGIIDLEAIKTSFITLVPKVNNPETINDFRPIALLNCSVKILTKILAERLQTVILNLLHVNQYGFLRSRSIQDCLAWCFEYIHQCHQSKKQIIILKLDFAKAFDTVEHSAMLEVMKHMGFPSKWLHWINMLFSSGQSCLAEWCPWETIQMQKRSTSRRPILSPLIYPGCRTPSSCYKQGIS